MDDGLLRSAHALQQVGNLTEAARLYGEIAREAAALKLARDTQAIRAIRARLTTNRETHPLFDTIRFTRNLEKAYVEMWARAERGEAPVHFAVESVP